MKILLLLVVAQALFGQSGGTVIAGGGGGLDSSIWRRFVALAGGPDASIAVIPTANEDGYSDSSIARLRDTGARNITLLHTRDPAVADSEKFVEPLETAGGVWIGGGRQWHLVDAYLNTRSVRAMHAVLARGGVIGGNSAGASILGSYLVRGGPDDNRIVMARGYEQGFGFLRGVAVDQHLLARDRMSDMLEVVAAHPDILGIGVDEHTVAVIQGDWLEVAGTSKVAIYESGKPYYFLPSGARFNMRSRERPASAIEPSAVEKPFPVAFTISLGVIVALALWLMMKRYSWPAKRV